jgi:hypothetical protein
MPERVAIDPVSASVPKRQALALSSHALKEVGKAAKSLHCGLVVFLGMSRVSRAVAHLHPWMKSIPCWAVVHEDFQVIGDQAKPFSPLRLLFQSPSARWLRPLLYYSRDAIPEKDRSLARHGIEIPLPLIAVRDALPQPKDFSTLRLGVFGTGSRSIDGLEEVSSHLAKPLKRLRFVSMAATRNPEHLSRLKAFDPDASAEYLSESAMRERAASLHLSAWVGDRAMFRVRASAGLTDPLTFGVPLAAWDCPFSRFMAGHCSAIRLVKDAKAMAQLWEEWDEGLSENEWRALAASAVSGRESLTPKKVGELIRAQWSP